MAATKQDVDRWIAKGREMGATHIISVCDTFDYSDYPVYIMPGDNLQEEEKRHREASMQRINETIKL